MIRGWVRSPTAWHYASLVVAGVILIVLSRDQWFFFDEWDFLSPSHDGELFSPHVGHWSTGPILITHALRAAFGLHTYLPYIVLSLAVHLGIVHVVWRIMRRVGTNPWIAMALGVLLAFLGLGAENIFWAFQLGFMGAMLLGLIVILLLDLERLRRRDIVLVVVLSILSLTFSGTSLAILAAAGVVSLVRRGLWRTLALLGPAGLVYVAWYLLFARGNPTGFEANSPYQFLVQVPVYVAHVFGDGFSKALWLPYSGYLVSTVLLVVAVVLVRTSGRATVLATALFGAALLQATLTAVVRLNLGTGAAASGRYIYALIVLCLPLIGLALSLLAKRGRWAFIAVIALIAVIAGYNASLLPSQAHAQAALENHSHERLSAALAEGLADNSIDPTAVPEPVYAPDITMDDLLTMHANGWFDVGPYDEAATLSVAANLDLVVTPGEDETSTDCTELAPGEGASFDGDVALKAPSATTVAIALERGGDQGDARTLAVPRGWSTLSIDSSALMTIAAREKPVTVCAIP